jgi:hypothetical protein
MLEREEIEQFPIKGVKVIQFSKYKEDEFDVLFRYMDYYFFISLTKEDEVDIRLTYSITTDLETDIQQLYKNDLVYNTIVDIMLYMRKKIVKEKPSRLLLLFGEYKFRFPLDLLERIENRKELIK